MKSFKVINKDNCPEDIWGEKDFQTVTIAILILYKIVLL